ncbi:hypothetical protein ATCV1_z388L [Acanthocystis turfacea chlorella virus 1]|uniref:Uncharacterized protein z388L n=1 Tax=Chlorovirus heliozoae TaxID=322019 RepID=A7K8Z8_9PHYC|nr:hypothetical protein ATCV1_z388L [Acanthocystis turfacea chlorella virus 1]ABT16522.1 hypothetical protein ATCV1_z388L [Acanthocystis turfacea chlorella virus 1]
MYRQARTEKLSWDEDYFPSFSFSFRPYEFSHKKDASHLILLCSSFVWSRLYEIFHTYDFSHLSVNRLFFSLSRLYEFFRIMDASHQTLIRSFFSWSRLYGFFLLVIELFFALCLRTDYPSILHLL